MIKKGIIIFLIIGSFLILNGCSHNALNYRNFSEFTYNGNKYYLYDGIYPFYFRGEKRFVGYMKGYDIVLEKAYILESDLEENIIFIDDDYGKTFWLKEGYKFIDFYTPFQKVALTFCPFYLNEEEDSIAYLNLDNCCVSDIIGESVKVESGLQDAIMFFLSVVYNNDIYCSLGGMLLFNDNIYFYEHPRPTENHCYYTISRMYVDIIGDKIEELYEETK